MCRFIIKDYKPESTAIRLTAAGWKFTTFKKLQRKNLSETYPVSFAIFVAIISAGLSLGVGKLQNQSENREYNQLKQQAKNLSDSIAILQIHIKDSARHVK